MVVRELRGAVNERGLEAMRLATARRGDAVRDAPLKSRDAQRSRHRNFVARRKCLPAPRWEIV